VLLRGLRPPAGSALSALASPLHAFVGRSSPQSPRPQPIDTTPPRASLQRRSQGSLASSVGEGSLRSPGFSWGDGCPPLLRSCLAAELPLRGAAHPNGGLRPPDPPDSCFAGSAACSCGDFVPRLGPPCRLSPRRCRPSSGEAPRNPHAPNRSRRLRPAPLFSALKSGEALFANLAALGVFATQKHDTIRGPRAFASPNRFAKARA
jgi:hypothetical protein